ncbi:cytochrome c oxidase subunit III [Helicobacter heilmannii]|uniref:Putative periplasmic protein n=1 Tax=Helicobacter heilmannii TaxID=35817 RepID=A0A0K2YDS6_HELHE|nr:cytochrome c [Helicobacter heilmannii]BDQ28008.1 cytochrome c oxidase subunit III [Helicobacter heilmannii]CRI35145.1 Putative periplasmic protein [Helicobacter heilmannii]
MLKQSVLLIGILLVGLFGADKPKDGSFITILEYGKELYKNPRNISCVKCHGIGGRGQVITRYTTATNQERIFKAPPINNFANVTDFTNALDRAKSIMPRYNLTPDEIKAIYYYLRSTKDKQP